LETIERRTSKGKKNLRNNLEKKKEIEQKELEIRK